MSCELYYWISGGQAEVDFLISQEGKIFPLEVKAGTSTRQKNLTIYVQKYHPEVASRASLMNLKGQGNFCNYPLYLVGRFPDFSGKNTEQ